MMNEPILPGRCEAVEARRVLVLAPHFDDEILGCGGLLLALREQGAAVHLLFLSSSGALAREDGRPAAAADRRLYAERRRQEAAAVAAELGASMAELGLDDGALAQQLDALAAGIGAALHEQQPDLVLLPSPLEVSRDHRATFAAVHQLLAALRGEAFAPFAGLRFFTYEVNFPQHPDLLFEVSERLERLAALMALHASQQERHDYWAARRGLLEFRALSLPPTVKAAEAYRRLTAEDFRLRGPAALIAHLGGQPALLAVDQGPLVSVVVRTKDRPEFLAEALASLASSTYRRLEVVLVNDGGAPPALAADFPLRVTRVELDPGRGRAGAANAGIAAASGDYICFLDDDDLVEPEHFEKLVAVVRAHGVRVAYSDAAVGVYAAGGPRGWQEVERRLPYSRDFDPELLLLDNYIPFHTLIFDRRLLAEVGEIDPSFPFFEDWEFLIRLAARAPFHHLPQVTCEYRHFRGAGHHILGDQPRAAADFLAQRARVLEKHAERIQPELIARVIDRLRAETVAAEEGRRAAEQQLPVARRETMAAEGRARAVETHNLVLVDAEARARLLIDQLRRELEAAKVAHAEDRQRLDGELARAYQEIARLESLRQQMEASRAWQLHLFLGRFRR